MNRLRHRPDRGFTLVELLVVIVVLGLLAAVVVLAMSTLRSRSVENACAADRRAVETAVELYYATRVSSGLPTDDPMGALVEEGLLRTPSANHTVETDGELIAISGAGECFSGDRGAMTMMRVVDGPPQSLMMVSALEFQLSD